MENKEQFVKELGELLSKFGVEGITSLEYEKGNNHEIVIVRFGSNYKIVNVHMDSLAAIVRDVMGAL